jgi:hypothetical protein
MVMGTYRLEVSEAYMDDLNHLTHMGCFTEIINSTNRCFIPDNNHAVELIAAILDIAPVEV